MLLYHFCAAHMVESIKDNGLTLGSLAMPTNEGTLLAKGCQWLTEEPDPRKQSWATRNTIPYSRTDYRLSVWIPKRHSKRLRKASELVPALPPESRKLITAWDGSDKWYVYLGNIPAKWICEIDRMCEEITG